MPKLHTAAPKKRAGGGTIGGGHTAGWCSGSTPASTTGERRIVTAGLPPRARSAWAPHGHSASFSTGHARSAAVRRDRAADVASRSWAGGDPARTGDQASTENYKHRGRFSVLSRPLCRRQPGQTGPPGWGAGRLYGRLQVREPERPPGGNPFILFLPFLGTCPGGRSAAAPNTRAGEAPEPRRFHGGAK